MSVRITYEIGHEAAIREKRTDRGFTHDWVVFVRGCDGANIHYYVEKVVFYLHDTFPKPKRVIKEPPYVLKESGYAGFPLHVEIYLRNKDEPKKITLTYELYLQPEGAPISFVQTKKYVFNAPGEDFKLKLLQGGGVIVNSQDVAPDSRSLLDDKMLLVSKPKLGGSEINKKQKMKIEEPRNSFHELFGAPITKTSKMLVDAKSVAKNKSMNVGKSVASEKEKSKNKHSPHKDKDKDKVREKDLKSREERKREERKERSKDREDRKDKKEKRDKSPKARSETPTKRIVSPSLPKQKEKDDKKVEPTKERKTDEREKLEKKLKKDKRDKEKERKDAKYKEQEQKAAEQKENKSLLREKDKHKEPSPLPPKNGSKEKFFKEKDILKDSKDSKEELEKNEKIKIDKSEEKIKHKHKKKDRDKKEKEKLSEKIYKSEKKAEKSSNSKYVESTKEPPKDDKGLFSSPKQTSSTNEVKLPEKPKKPLGALMAEFNDNNSSNSSISSHEDLFNEPPILKHEAKKEVEVRPEPDTTKPKREKVKKSKDKKAEKSSEKKRKRKSENVRIEEPVEKMAKEETSNSKESDVENFTQNDKQEDENYEDYMNILRDLQHKILTLQDNSELQRVVQLIAETGRFEVSAQTFDFDLCLLERSTITQLQNFFQSTS